MAFVVFKGERKLTELVERAYGSELTAAEKTRAVAAIERANPHLGKLKDVAPGSLVVVPKVPGLAPTAARSADPVSEGVREVADALSAYRRDLAFALKQAGGRMGQVKEMLASEELRNVVVPEGGGAERLERIAKATQEREEFNELASKAVDAMEAATAELVELADRLR